MSLQIQTKKWKFLLASIPLLSLAGCTTFTQDSSYQEIASYVKSRGGSIPQQSNIHAHSTKHSHLTQQILTHPLSADSAVQVALLNNAGLQTLLTVVDVAQADLMQAGRMHNPTFSYTKLTPVIAEYNIERTILFDVMSLLTIPLRTAMEKQHFEQAKLQAAHDILGFAAKTRKAYFHLVAAEQKLHYMEKVKDSAQVSAELAQQMAQAGNISQLQKAREQAFYKETVAQYTRAKITAIKKRENLIRLMGLAGNAVLIKLPERLPELPARLRNERDLEKTALNTRLDIQVRRQELNRKRKALGLTKTTRFINVLDLGYVRNSAHDEPHQTGYEINFEIPLFDWGGAKVAKAESLYMQSAWRLRETILNACSQAREHYRIYQMTYEVAKNYRDEILPLRKKILHENILRYNGMLLSPFELLVDKREQMISMMAAIEAHRDFWLAETDMQTALLVQAPEQSHAEERENI